MPRPKGYKAQSIATDDPRLPAIVKRLKAGKTSLREESTAVGFSHNGPLRKALRDLIGRDKYDALMEGSRPKAGAKKAEAKKPADEPNA